MRLQLIIVAMACTIVHTATLKDSYGHFVSLDEDENYLMYWTTNDATQTIDIAISVKTTGWVGFGISPYTGRMPGSDTVIGWVSNGKAYLQDRYAESRTTPILDASQDYNLISGEEIDGTTILKFSRKYNTADSNDLPLQNGTSRLIWSYHSSDPVTPDSFTIHEKQGSRSLNLFDSIPEIDKPPMPKDTQTFQITHTNLPIPSKHTTYWCKTFKLPEFNESAHIIKVSPYIQKGHEGLVHHINIHDCPLNEKYIHENHDCFSGNMPSELMACRGGATIFAWGVGGEDITFPEHVGFPMGGSHGTRFVILEIHYDNPNLTPGILDSSGMVIHYTHQKRRYDAGSLLIGRASTSHMIVPERQPHWQIAGYCAKDCTQQNFPPNGINVFASLSHTHLAGIAVKVKQYRNDAELGILTDNPHYDFNYQDFAYLRKPKKVLPGDQLTVICTYNTKDRVNYTRGGFSTRDEMCLVYLYYYPKQKMGGCYSWENKEDYKELSLSSQTGKTRTIGDKIKDLIQIENTAHQFQWCIAQGRQLLQAEYYMRIPDVVIQKTNLDILSGGKYSHSYSSMLITFTALFTYLILSRL